MIWKKPVWSLWLLIYLLAVWPFSGGQEEKKAPAFSFVLTFPLKEMALFTLAGRPGPNLLYNQNRIYAYTEAGQVVCYDLREKKIIWTSRLPHPTLAAPVLADNNLLVVDQDNNLACFSPEGNLLWEKKLPEPYGGRQTVWDDKLLLASAENRLLAFKVSSGEMTWRVEVDSPVRSFEVISDTSLIVLSSQGKIYLFSSNGDQNLVGSVGQEILPFAFSTEDRLLLATADRSVVCWDLKRKRPAWKLRLGGQVAADPLVVKKRLYVAAANAVLYCLNLGSGEIQWWKPLPSPLVFGLLACGEAILVATVNPPLLAFDARKGQELGRWEVEGEICSPVFFVDNLLAIATFDPIAGDGFWHFLEPKVEVSVVSSAPSPIKLGEKVTFTAVARGFVRPRFEFSLLSREGEKVVQQEKEKASWTWVPLEPGDYTIMVRVRDERRKAEASISFQVIQEVP
ncbi:MAG: outer membrane protein assembly factor BamB family protein [Candidatus Aminicenantales bacterium]